MTPSDHPRPDILCIGSVLWDVVGRAGAHVPVGGDVPGRITRLPGGVALNIAVTLAQLGLRPALLSCVGTDGEGEALVAACDRIGLTTATLFRSPDLPTDRYMAIEGATGLIAAIADTRSLEAAGARILAPLRDGRIATPDRPWTGLVALDGNLTEALLRDIATSPLFAAADLRVASASPDKAHRLAPLLAHPQATLYLNLAEAGHLAAARFVDAPTAAQALVARGAARVLVTDGARLTADAQAGRATCTAGPPPVSVARVTGAGDTFMAAHIAAERYGADRTTALSAALRAAAAYVSGEIGS